MIRKKVEKTVTVGEGDAAKEIEIFVQQPNNGVLKRADQHKSKIWNQAVRNGVLTKQELGLVMKERGIWNEEKEKEEKQLGTEIAALEKELYLGKGTGKGKRKPKLSEGRDLAIEIRRKRMELRALLTEKIAMEENTADNLADNARFDFLVAHCTFFKNGQPVYKNYEEYDSRSADEIAFAAAGALSEMLYNLDTSFEKNLAENKFLLKYNLVNDDLSLIDPNSPDHLIDTEGRRIDDEGYYLNDEGKRTDKEGNLLTEDGDYEMVVEFENDLLVKPVTKTKEKTTES